MTPQDFTTTILVDQTPRQAFDAINNVRGWWSESIDGSTDRLHSVFNYNYKDVHLTKFEIIELVPGKRVVWLVLDNYFNFTEDKHEWKGTNVIFDISKKNGKTEVCFTHRGLVPQYECYNVCNEAWTHYIQDSLRSLITTGKGEPNPLETEGFNATMVEKWKLAK
ncbi:SRPBCC domain-containing protein [Chitinophaga lutea]|uniref:SRPBCC domain-containing protein n=1 Tax=Chitinophaga lutea TaxID=2488634 RepID=A0A3N4PP02_9BACT|nr:SRPBCC domain-containing protein [Chitinophaga lutea]RPE08389.1 SRPBCC domain-containing protein [Chitinophaga lutea]